jgi:hypothetical protein
MFVQVGRPCDTNRRPADTCIAGFVGCVNLLKSEVAIPGGKRGVRKPVELVECHGPEKVTEGQQVTMGMRAESPHLRAAAEERHVNCFSGKVQSAILVGMATENTVNPETRLFSVKMPATAHAAAAGQRVGVVIPPESWSVMPVRASDSWLTRRPLFPYSHRVYRRPGAGGEGEGIGFASSFRLLAGPEALPGGAPLAPFSGRLEP